MDTTFQLLWKRYRTWADTSSHLKAVNTSWKRRVLGLTLAGTALATLGPFASHLGAWGGWLARGLPILGAAALAMATYFGKQLLDTKHEEAWTRARAAAEAYKSEANRYLVQAPPYDGADPTARLQARLTELAEATRDLMPDDISAERAVKGMPADRWTIEAYVANRLDEQITWYRTKARAHSESMSVGRTMSLSLGGLSVLLGVLMGAITTGAAPVAAILGLVTTTGASLGAYFHAGHDDAIALKYRQTADALELLKLRLATAATPHDRGEIVVQAEAIMQAENAAWLQQLKPTAAPA